jgi:hypothetical protein
MSQPLPAAEAPATSVAARTLNVNLVLRTMLVVTAILALAWVFVYVRSVMMSLFLALLVRSCSSPSCA